MNKKAINVIKGFLTAYAMRVSIGVPLLLGWYETKGDWIIGNIYELLGYYDFVFLLLWVVCACFYHFVSAESESRLSINLVSAFFAIMLPMGQCLRDYQSALACVGCLVNIIKTVLIVLGFFFFFKVSLAALKDIIVKKNFVANKDHFFTKKPFIKAFIILTAVYSLVTLICYPGNLNADTIGQIYQVYGEMPYSEHHPLLSTFLVGGLVRGFEILTGSQAVGLFVYTLLQGIMMAAALSFSIHVLSTRKLCGAGVWTVLLLYIVTPVYTNIISTAIKDVPFMAFVIVYVIMLLLFIEEPARIAKGRFFAGFVGTQTMVMLFRNNGIYMLVITGFVLWLVNLKKFDLKKKLISLLGLFLLAFVLAKLIGGGLSCLTGAEKGAKGEMLSLPFQMVGKYYSEYPEDITDEEMEIIESVLGPAEGSLARYNPELADQIKARFVRDCTTRDLVNFMGVWAKLFVRHPLVYIDGALMHTYGWYCPVPSSEKRYETPDDDYLTPTGIFEVIDKGMVFLYRFLNRISLLGAMENVGVATWAYIFLFICQDSDRLKKYRLVGVYMLTALLICFAAPAFFEHTRYGFPILFTVPFVFAFSLAKKDTDMVQ